MLVSLVQWTEYSMHIAEYTSGEMLVVRNVNILSKKM